MRYRPSEWVCFEPSKVPARRKTLEWFVRAREGGMILGWIAWYGRWRRYAFVPQVDTVFEQDCLRQIATFIETKTREHRKEGGQKGGEDVVYEEVKEERDGS